MQTALAIQSEMKAGVRALGRRLKPHGQIEDRRTAVAHATKLSNALVDRLWYGNVSRIDTTVSDTIRALTTAEERLVKAQQTTTDLRAELADLQARFDRLISLIGDGQNERA